MKTVVFSLTLLLFACTRPPETINSVLDAAGSNRLELEKVIDHYKSNGDNEKLKAAYFLIGNMEDKYAIGGEDLKRYNPIFDFFQSLRQKRLQVTNNSVFVKAKWDSLVRATGGFNKGSAEIVPDSKKSKRIIL